MSINTNATPKNTEIREENKLRPADMMPPKKSPESVELEISLPMLVVIILAFCVVVYSLFSFFGKQNPDSTVKETPTELKNGLADVTITTDKVVFQGSKTAKYMFVEYSDFECPYCQQFAIGTSKTVSTFSQIMKRYVDTGIMQYGYETYIAVPQHKPAATNEALGFYCAAAQGKAFEFHEKTFKTTVTNGLGLDGKSTSRDSVIALAKSINGINEKDFTACYDKRDIVSLDKIQEQVDREIRKAWADKFGAQNFGTPAFAMCKISSDKPGTCVGKAYVGAWPYEDMKTVIDEFLGADAPKSN